MIFKINLELIFYDERQSVFKKSTDFSSMLAMTIADREKVAMPQTQKVRTCNVSILIDFVGVMCWETCFCCKWKLRDYVCYLRRSLWLLLYDWFSL